jgi:ATP-dependent DNA ligase
MDTNDLFKGDLLNLGEIPKTDSWKFIPLFKEGVNGEIRVWQIGFDFEKEELKTVHGILITTKGEDGQLITAYHPIVTNKSGRSLQEQGLLEARKRYLDQYSNGYLPKGEELPPDLNGTEPMLAKTLRLNANVGKCKSNETRLEKYPVSVMPKLDGIRCLARALNDNTVQTRSRNNKAHEAPLTHIKEELTIFLKYLPPNSELDGELYSLDMNFEKLSGVIRTKKRKHEEHDLVKFFIFDLIESKRLTWLERYTLLVNSFNQYCKDGNPHKHIQIVQSYNAMSEADVLKYHDNFVNEGYEGIIIRRYASTEIICCKDKPKLCKKCEKAYMLTVYRSRRTNALLKYKNFMDEEVTIIGFEVGVGTEDGAIIYKVLDKRGNEFTVRPRGTIDERRELYKTKEKLLKLPYTIRYQELSEKGVPRFPVGIGLRDYE